VIYYVIVKLCGPNIWGELVDVFDDTARWCYALSYHTHGTPPDVLKMANISSNIKESNDFVGG
jgi:hypothetical protein